MIRNGNLNVKSDGYMQQSKELESQQCSMGVRKISLDVTDVPECSYIKTANRAILIARHESRYGGRKNRSRG